MRTTTNNTSKKMNTRKKKKDGRGGARIGAGAKCRSAEGKRETFSVRLLPSSKALLIKMKEQGVALGDALDEVIPVMAAHYGIAED